MKRLFNVDDFGAGCFALVLIMVLAGASPFVLYWMLA